MRGTSAAPLARAFLHGVFALAVGGPRPGVVLARAAEAAGIKTAADEVAGNIAAAMNEAA